MKKPSVSRTLGPIHFEDLDPHRFEDLVRELIYDFKDWQSIEATGRSGQDGGFDVRAFERVRAQREEADAEEVEPGSNDGNLWMVQAKREKTLGPARIKAILKDVDVDNPPYGYILAVAADISKKTYDVFREELRQRGVTEFHLWSKAELEDMLHQPKYDRILFTFFGISLVSRRRSRGTEIRQVVSTKNKLLRTLGEDSPNDKSILVRDIEDTFYPYQDEQPDFAVQPGWQEYLVDSQHPRGVIVKQFETFGYVDVIAKEYDYAERFNSIRTETQLGKSDPIWLDQRGLAEQQWEHLPSYLQAMFHRNGIIRYRNIVVIDEMGDLLYQMPHLFVARDPNEGLISQSFEFLTVGDSVIRLDGFKRVHKWPTSDSKTQLGTIHPEGTIPLSEGELRELANTHGAFTLYDFDGKYGVLKPYDAVKIQKIPGRGNSQFYFEVTHIETLTLGEYQRRAGDQSWRIERVLGRKPDDDATVTIIEGRRRYDFEIERSGPGEII